MILHLSQLAGLVVPFAGLVVPIVIWQIKKAEMPELDAHGRAIANWMISELIYWAIAVVLMFVLVGFLLALVLGVLALVFPIIGGIRAGEGELWKYPFSFKFI